jgi:hypothetical protein
MKILTSAASLAAAALVAGAVVAPALAGGQTAAATGQITALTSLSGTGTSLGLNAAATASLRGAGITVAPTGTAKMAGSTFTFPITSGYLQINSDRAAKPGWIEGAVQHDGSGLALRRGGATVTLGNFSVDPGDSLLSGTVDGTQTAVPLLALDGAKATVTRSGGDLNLTGVEASWTPTAVTVLNVVLHSHLEPGVPLATFALHADATADHPFPATDIAEAIPHLPGGATTVTVTPKVLSTFSGASVSIRPTGSATESPASPKGRVLAFPVTAGMIVLHKNHAYKPGFVVGSLAHDDSGLTFSGGGKTVRATDLVADPGDSVMTATVGSDAEFPLFFLNGANIKDQVTQLTPAAARLLDHTFGTTAFTPYLTLGPLAVVAK